MVLDEDGSLVATDKVFSTPADPAAAVREALGHLDPAIVSGAHLLHGSTVATNALIERNGVRIGLIVTRGFRDIVFLQRQDREEMYDLKLVKPRPLVEREDVYEVDERLDARGGVIRELDEASVRTALERMRADGITSVAVSLLHSYANPAHEQRIAEIASETAPEIRLALSSQSAREFREYERTTTTTIDAFLRPRIAEYIGRLAEDASASGMSSLQVMQSNGGMVPAETAALNPLTMLRSGPAAGVAGAIAVAQAAGIGDIVTMDMGGTSTDVAVIRDGRADLTSESTADGLPLRVPMVDIVAVGAGGGSLVDVDSGGLLTVGPRSAGASPGPVSYGRGGTQITVTDANVVRGLLRPEVFLGGTRTLDRDAAVAAMRPLAERLGRTVEGLAEDIYRLASVHMSTALRMTTTERGYEVSEYTLCAYGGAGALHAAAVAEELGIERVIIPPYNGLASAYGLLTAGFRREFGRTNLVAVDELDDAALGALTEDLRTESLARLAAEGVDLREERIQFSADMRYQGQGFEVLVDFPSGADQSIAELREQFEAVHLRRYGYLDPGKGIQLVTLRMTLTMEPPAVALPRVDIDPTLPRATQTLIEGERPVEAAFVPRRALEIGEALSGPAVVEDDTSTTFVPSGWRAVVDEQTNIILEREGATR
ncbi:hydantoinase/oxoprolinase family protein [Leucobacter allii]|uniref:Hydantoinase/oxoprolinase family protein n=1 Tax=Leucobacter allii TaxID=2932247 RepID=A0ABY4FLM0_9MICO|nr:hydantoinase/oxoprolinase family protein [Leucobacter allii]UOQ57177.1 hydantoinase/oxoprolinase family protein [Leucobacter allii]